MAEKCTNTSSPVERWMNPYPFAPLNHFTVPFSLTDKTPFTNREELFLRIARTRFDRPKPPSKHPVEIADPLTMCGRSTSKIEKTPQSHRGMRPLRELRSPTIWRVSTTPQQPFTYALLVSPPDHFPVLSNR